MTVPSIPSVAGGADGRPRRVAAEKFINPYNFVSTPDRSGYNPATLGDSAPTSHARLRLGPDTYSGSIPITITTRTPLLLPDQPRSNPPQGTTPRTAGTRTGPDGEPLLLGSTVKGMLRSAYEAITNSRFGVVDDTHRERGAVRKVLFPNSPLDLLDEEHRPAAAVGGLAPADRVFGWTRPGGEAGKAQSAHRAKIRITAPAIVDQPEGGALLRLPSEPILATLNGPKTTQYRFYVGDKDQNPLENGQRRDPAAGFNTRRGHRLRGRKFYVPQPEVFKEKPGAAEYWTPGTNTDTVRVDGQARYREYLQSGERHPEVELAVKSWVKPGVTFETTLHVDNMTGTEIGALLWLLALPEEASLALGLGKPLGFGSVRVTADWERTQVRSAESQRQRYTTLVGLLNESTGCLDVEAIQKLIKTFDITLYQCGLAPVRKEFLDMVCGYTGAPVHYPRAASGTPQGQRPAPNGEFFKWWVANEKTEKLSLPATKDPALPYLDESRGPNKAGNDAHRYR